MMPAYRNMDSYPFQRNQIPFPSCYRPGTDTVPPQIRMDPSKSPFPYEQHWPYAGCYGHPVQHFCCGHNNFPGYYSYRPSYPHAPAPAPLPMYYSGGCPSYGEPFFVPYSPQSHYTMELPRYEYDKHMPREHHCCGCPNHPCYQKDDKSVKIEEHEPDVGNKVNDAAMAPVQLRNYPYPLVWIPPEYTGNRQLKNPTKAEVGEQDRISHDKKSPGTENFNADVQPAPEPIVWNGWLPFDMKGAPNLVHDGDGLRSQKREPDDNRRESEDGRINQKHQSEHKGSEFPFPIIWLPYYNKQEEGGRINDKKSNSTPECIEEVPHHTLKSVPVKSCIDEGAANRTRSNEVESTNTSAPDVIKKVTNERSIPMKQMKSHQGKNDSEGSEKREVSVPVNRVEENVTKKDSQSSSKRRSTSPPKASKLPPVCLRVDALPRKKNGNRSSRSPSPPSSKEHSQATAGETSKTPSSGMNDKAKSNSNLQNAANTSEKVTPKERLIQVSEIKTSENKGAECRDNCQSQINMPSGVSTEIRESYTDGGSGRYKTEDKKEERGAENMAGDGTEHSVKDKSAPTDEGGKKEGRVLLDADAAVLIQAAYRGYQVRKWEPLKKLKQIAEVSKEVTDVRGRIQAFEGSSGLQNDDKQKIAIGETIMRLLLKLDTIQGLHPSFREIRKSLARELVTLQERLDFIMAKKSQQQMQEFNVQKPVEVTPLNTQNGEYCQEQQEEKVAVPGDSSEGINDENHDTLDKHQDQFCMKDGDNNLLPNDGGSESQFPIDPTSNEGTEPSVQPNGLVSEDISPVVAGDASSSLSETDKTAVECEAKSEVNDTPIEDDKLDITAMKELPVGVFDEDIIDVSSGKNKQDEKGMVEAQPIECTTMMKDRSLPGLASYVHAMMELPVGLLDEDTVTSEFGKDDETNVSKEGVLAENDKSSLEELPVGLIDEEGTEKSEFEKHDDETKTHKEILPAEGEECNANERTGSSTAEETQLEQPQLEEQQQEVQSSGEVDGWVKIEFHKDELKGDAPLDVEESGEGNGNDTKLPFLTTQVNGLDQGNEEACLEANDAAKILPEPMEFVPVNDFQREKEPEDNFAQQETQVDGQEMVTGQTICADDDEGTKTLAKEETELFIAGNDAELNGDKKLLEENEKLRKMIKKVLEAGNEQLSVISNLTGRVKDLEKKLARTKRSRRVRTKWYRPATSKMSCSKSSE